MIMVILIKFVEDIINDRDMRLLGYFNLGLR